MSTHDSQRPTSPLVRWWLGLSWGQIARTLLLVATGVVLLVWWASSGVLLASRLLEYVIQSPHARQEVLAYLGAFYITWKVIGRRLLRRRRAQWVSAPALSGVALPAGRNVTEDARWSLERRARHEAAHAVACAWVGNRVELVDIKSVAGRGGRMVPADDERPLADHAWGRLVTLVAGQLVDTQAGMHDYGASNDMGRALEAIAAIVSTGQRPTGYAGELTTDALLVAARHEATTAISTHADVLDAVVAALLADPTRPVHGIALDALLEPVTRTARKAATS